MYRIGILVCALLWALPAQAALPEHSATLQNGMRVLVQQDDRFPLVATRLMVRAGVIHEQPEMAGMSHFLEHIVFRSTKNRPDGGLSREVEQVGGDLNAWTYFDRISFETNMPASHWQLGMNIVWDEAAHALILPQELAAEKEVVVSEIQRGQDEPFRALNEMQRSLRYKGTVYGHSVIGTPETVRGITAEAMRAYYRRWFQPANMLLVVAGKVEPQAVFAEAERLFGSLQNTQAFYEPDALDMRTVNAGRAFAEQKGAWNKVYLGVSFPAPQPDSPQAVPFAALLQLLTGDRASFFDRRYMFEHHLVDMVTFSDMALESGNSISFYFMLDAPKLPEFWNMFMQDMAQLQAAAFTSAELDRVQLRMEDSLFRNRETVTEGLADWLAMRESKLGGKQGEANQLAGIRNLTFDAVQEALSAWLRPEYMQVAVLYPEKAQSTDLEALSSRLWPAPQMKQEKDTALGQSALEQLDLGGGRTLLLLPDDSMPYTAASLTFTGGDALLSPQEQGLGVLTSTMLTAGTGDKDAQAMERYLAARAASLSASSGRQTFTLSMRQPSRFNGDMFALLGQVLAQPAFLGSELQRVKKEQLAAIAQSMDRATGILRSKASGVLYPNHPYGYQSLGEAAQVQAMSTEQVREFWAKQQRQPWVLAVAGKFDRAAVLEAVQQLPKPSEAGLVLAPPAWGQQQAKTWTLPGREQAHCMLFFKGVPTGHSDMPALTVLGELLGGGMGSPLFSELRDKQGLAYTVYSVNRSMQESGSFQFYIGTTEDKLTQAQQSFYAVVQDLLRKAISKESLEGAVNMFRGSYERGQQTLDARAAEAASLVAVGLPASFARDLLPRLEAVTEADIHRVIKHYIVPENAYTLVVKP
ncbi:MAG: pitrilysin family protein [Desulfovibrionaceae bacterium]|nr:pitrilysin family protein [Desulfovibrionaceae bacterium]